MSIQVRDPLALFVVLLLLGFLDAGEDGKCVCRAEPTDDRAKEGPGTATAGAMAAAAATTTTTTTTTTTKTTTTTTIATTALTGRGWNETSQGSISLAGTSMVRRAAQGYLCHKGRGHCRSIGRPRRTTIGGGRQEGAQARCLSKRGVRLGKARGGLTFARRFRWNDSSFRRQGTASSCGFGDVCVSRPRWTWVCRLWAGAGLGHTKVAESSGTNWGQVDDALQVPARPYGLWHVHRPCT